LFFASVSTPSLKSSCKSTTADDFDEKHADHFKKLLKATCPNHTYPVKHKLKECTVMKNYMTMRNQARNKKPEGDSTVKAAAPFLEEKAVLSIYGGLAPPRVTPQTQAHLLGSQLRGHVDHGVPALV
jgi:hypothetical protein